MTEYDLSDVRAMMLPNLREHGFQCSPGLPLVRELELRPKQEIAKRLAAIKAVVGWVCYSEEQVPFEPIGQYFNRYGLRDYISTKESKMIDTPRDRAQDYYLGEIGWPCEGAWALAWVLGYSEPPDVFGEMISDEQIVDVMRSFAPDHLSAPDLEAWISECTIRDEMTEVGLEDTFYCVHNAARSAQIGSDDCVPPWFHPTRSGGIIQERRHALTWALSPNVKWDETDLST